MLCPLLYMSASASVSSAYSPPSHMVRHRNFIFDVNVHTCPQYMHIKYLVILTYSFSNGSHFGTFPLICSPAYTDNHRNFIIGRNMLHMRLLHADYFFGYSDM